ncbi:hypothetical protein TNCV_3181251 [Trichonephila clavipes]|nr:hypothetical protein TNCV_3181251 [Trichonephila clavipes]
MNGCVAAISVDTGKVLDIEVMSSTVQHVRDFRLCQETLNMSRQKPTTCQCNFTGSSSKMEIVGASRIFLRSEKNRQTAIHSILWGWRLKSFHECERRTD